MTVRIVDYHSDICPVFLIIIDAMVLHLASNIGRHFYNLVVNVRVDVDEPKEQLQGMAHAPVFPRHHCMFVSAKQRLQTADYRRHLGQRATSLENQRP